jgi:outer membrane lipoprotein-sorting protein
MKYLLAGMLFFHCLLWADSETFIKVGQAETEQFMTQMRQEMAKVKSVAFCFRQEKHLVLFEDVLHLRGWCYVEKPDKIRWEYVSPIRKKIVLCGDEVKVYKGLEEIHAEESQGMQMVYRYILAFFSGKFEIDQTHFILALKKSERDQDIYLLEMTSQGKLSQFVAHMAMKISKKSSQLVQFLLVEANGDYTVIEAESYTLNPQLFPGLFGKKVIENFQDGLQS